MNLKPYENNARGEAAAYKNIPIELRSQVLDHFRKSGTKVRLKFRGKRTQVKRHQRQSTCLLRDANRFSVYFEVQHYNNA